MTYPNQACIAETAASTSHFCVRSPVTYLTAVPVELEISDATAHNSVQESKQMMTKAAADAHRKCEGQDSHKRTLYAGTEM